MISLLDDKDSEIVNAVTQSLMGRGTGIISELESAWEAAFDSETQEKIEHLIQILQFTALKEELRAWTRSGSVNILEGAILVARLNFPNLRYADIHHAVESIRKDVWLEISDKLTALEKVKIINYVVFQVHGFGKISSGMYDPQGSCINQVIETKMGNPISLAILYLAVTRKLGLPVFGVDLPGNFILAYRDKYHHIDPAETLGDVLFYINPYGKGAVLGRQEIDHYVLQQKLDPHPSYFEPCSNRDTINRLICHLMLSHERMGNLIKVQQLQELLDVILD